MSRTFRWVLAVLLLSLIGLAIVGLSLTRATTVSAGLGGKQAAGRSSALATVDQKPLSTARKLAPLAKTPQEQTFSAEALQLADHEVDLELARALHDAAEHPAPATARTIRLQHRVQAAQERVDTDQASVQRLTRLVKRTSGVAQVKYQAQLQVASAELSLDQDELKDAHRDMLLASGSEEAQLQELLNEQKHPGSEKSEKNEEAGNTGAATGAENAGSSAANAKPGHSLLAHLDAWEGVEQENHSLARAGTAALAKATSLQHAHDALQLKMQELRKARLAPTAGKGAPNSASELSSVQQLRNDQQDLSSLDSQIETSRELGNVYERWLKAAQARAQVTLHRLIRSALWVLVLLFLAVAADLLISHLFSGLSFDRKRMHTMHSVLRFATRGLAAVLILVVIFGPPRQLGTILGLVGAGLAVALKDFIVAFLGWFRLIGPNGMRPGDWVEINGAQQVNGVQGKVLEVGLLFTVILEAGNWTDAGHPTGRRVAFINSFAIEGYYFNFTTAGQWLWDEIQFGLPASLKPHPLLEALQRTAEKETENSASLAEQDWKRAMAGSGLTSFTAKPVITVRPTEAGLNVVIRYIARAEEREELRQRMFHAALEILHGADSPGNQPEDISTHAEPA